MAKAGILVLSSIGVLYDQLIKKGVFALVRFRKNEAGSSLQAHIDWDCDAYEGVVEHAKIVHEDKKRTAIDKEREINDRHTG